MDDNYMEETPFQPLILLNLCGNFQCLRVVLTPPTTFDSAGGFASVQTKSRPRFCWKLIKTERGCSLASLKSALIGWRLTAPAIS